MKNKQTITAGSIINPRSGAVYQTRDTVNALRMIRLLKSLQDWREKNQNASSAAVKRHVKQLSEVL